MAGPAVLVHGGAGDVPEAARPAHRAGCRRAAEEAGRLLAEGAPAVEAVVRAVEVLEDDSLYNAGTGCALDALGRARLDAAVMDGSRGRAGGVCDLPPFRNPVRIARALLEERPVLLAGEEAARFAERLGFRRLRDEDLIVPRSRAAWKHVVRHGGASNWAGGTVGAVALDAEGRLAAATSTGGMMGKAPGRVGDSPIPGAGTWADEGLAVSATGDGEGILQAALAAFLAAGTCRGADPGPLLEALLDDLRLRHQALAGAIALDRHGRFWARRTTAGMSHAWWTPEGAGDGV